MSYKKKAEAFCQHAFRKGVEMLTTVPRVLVSRAAYNRMWHYVDLADGEVGWLGTITRQGNDFLVEEVFLFKQEVSSTTTEISTEGLAEVAQELIITRPDGVEILNRLCFWGHSHVNMGTSPSGQDESQMQTFRESGHPFFVRGILNKQGRMEFTIFLYDSGVKIVDAEWAIYEPVDSSLRSEIAQEMATKVTEKKFYSPGLGLDGSFSYPRSFDDEQFAVAGKSSKKKEVRHGR
jgi:hypothetical protein